MFNLACLNWRLNRHECGDRLSEENRKPNTIARAFGLRPNSANAAGGINLGILIVFSLISLLNANAAKADESSTSSESIGFRDIRIGTPESVVNANCTVSSCYGLDDLSFYVTYSEPEEIGWTWDDVDQLILDLQQEYQVQDENKICEKLHRLIPRGRLGVMLPRYDSIYDFKSELIDIWGEDAIDLMSLGILMRYGAGESTIWQLESFCQNSSARFVDTLLVDRNTLANILAYYSPLPELPESERVVEKLVVALGLQTHFHVLDLISDPTNLFNELKGSLDGKYSRDWEFGDKEVENFVLDKTQDLWISYQEGQVFLNIEKSSNGGLELNVEYHTKEDGAALMKARKPKFSSTSDF